MVIQVCTHNNCKKNGTTKAGTVRWRCNDCGASWTESTEMFCGMTIGIDRAAKIIGMLCEGMSLSATARLTDTDIHTVTDLLNLVGDRCKRFLHEQIEGIHVDDVQCDEIWQFIYCKKATAKAKKIVGGCGDSYCFTAVERNTKLILAWHFGRRTSDDAVAFCRKLNRATFGRFQLSSDAFNGYENAVKWTLNAKVDYGQVVKQYGDTTREDQRKYSPANIIACRKQKISGQPDMARVCTSHSERHNGTIRNFVKRMGRLTYCFSKRWENHEAALALFFAHYNFCHKHRSLKGKTPAMASELAFHVWTVRELLEKTSRKWSK